MKKLLSLFLASSLLFSSCKKDDDVISTTNVSSTVSNGTWRITYFAESGVNKTSNYNGYNFTFGANNVVTAVKNTTTVTGTWTMGNDNSKVKLILAFTASNFDSLSEDWHVLERTDTKIRTQHISGGNGTTDELTFERN
ncbi:MAG: hypothetical protein KGZ59_02400 [Chitinophagaceae bacterium]|nr:hypothetical protein [Chitinophagaceae bacterium]